MRKNFVYDKCGRPWATNAPYILSPDIVKVKREQALAELSSTTTVHDFVVLLPFRVYPMWPPQKTCIFSSSDLDFCVCVKCARPLTTKVFARLALCFRVTKEESGELSMFWRPVVSCCDDIYYGVSLYPTLLCVETTLRKVLKSGLSNFKGRLTISKTTCYVCGSRLPCDNKICVHLMPHLSLTETPSERVFNLFKHFIEDGIDVVSPFAPKLCDARGCNKVTSEVPCKNCRRVRYCSKKCRLQSLLTHQAEGCVNFLKVWSW